ncbi:MAG: ABC transporter substrate-binding protein, partial [Deltaproteobacteria bacterium]|nr:ABC transporter substrate-binding protein [Deltaproteobacteria bacterium]
MRRSPIFWMVLSFVTIAFLIPQTANAQKKPILVGYPAILSGGGALFGQPSMVGGQMAVKDINEKGGVLGRPIELLTRDCKSTPDEATRVARELILKEKVQFLVGGFTASQGLALSEVAKTEKIIYIAPVSKSTAMTEPGKLHPYVFRAAANTNTEGRSAAVFMAKNPWKRVYTLGPDYEYGQMV